MALSNALIFATGVAAAIWALQNEHQIFACVFILAIFLCVMSGTSTPSK